MDEGITIRITLNDSLLIGTHHAEVSMDFDVWNRMQGNPNAVYLLLARLEHFARSKGDTTYRLETAPEEVKP